MKYLFALLTVLCIVMTSFCGIVAYVAFAEGQAFIGAGFLAGAALWLNNTRLSFNEWMKAEGAR